MVFGAARGGELGLAVLPQSTYVGNSRGNDIGHDRNDAHAAQRVNGDGQVIVAHDGNFTRMRSAMTTK